MSLITDFTGLGLLALAAMAQPGCSTAPSNTATVDLPCYDGWQASHGSYIWSPGAAVWEDIARQLPGDRSLVCFHRFRVEDPPLVEAGEVLVLSVDSAGVGHADSFVLSGQSVRYIGSGHLHTLR